MLVVRLFRATLPWLSDKRLIAIEALNRRREQPPDAVMCAAPGCPEEEGYYIGLCEWHETAAAAIGMFPAERRQWYRSPGLCVACHQQPVDPPFQDLCGTVLRGRLCPACDVVLLAYANEIRARRSWGPQERDPGHELGRFMPGQGWLR
jgi:hypothetical protein